MNLSRARLSELDERSLREDVLIPLFKAMGFRDVSLHHGGSLEQGKDIVMWRPEAIQARANYGVVAKVTGITGRATGKSSAAEVYTQVKQCFGKPFIDPVTLEERPVDRVLVVTSGEIIKEARESLRSLLASDGYDRSVELVDGDKLWELIDAHLPQRVVIDQLSQAARTLEDLSPNYRVVSKTGSDGVTLSLEPKHPDAAAREPAAMKFTVAFPDTQEGRALKDAMEKWMKTGEAFEIPGGYVKDFEPPTFLESVMPKDAVYSISLGPRASGHELIADLVAVSSDGSESASLSHVQFRTLRGGAEEVVFSSSHQQAPWHFTLTLQDQGRRASISAQFDFSGCSVREEYDALKFLDVVSKGAELAIRGARTKLTYFRGLIPQNPKGAPPPEVLAFLDVLARLQELVGVRLAMPPREITNEEFELAHELLNKTTTGQANQRATAITIEITREGARRALQEYASASRHTLTLTTTESHVLFGMPIHLGEVRYTMTDVMLSEEDRQAVERALAAPGAEYVSLRLSATEHSRLQAIYPRWLPKGEPTSPS